MLDIKSKRTLLALLAEGKTFTYHCFWAGPFSQWHPAPMKVDGKFYPTAEHYMMAEKARLFNDQEAEKEIMKASGPREAKAWGRKVKNFDQNKWMNKCYDIVYAGSMAKYTQHEHLKSKLLSTGDNILVEASPKDPIWGIGLSEEHPNARNPHKWPGQNLLGFVLTNVREDLKTKEKQ